MRKLAIILLATAMTVLLSLSNSGEAVSAQAAEVDVGIELLGIVGATGDPPTLKIEITPDAPDLTIVKEERITHSTPVDQRLHFQWFPPPGMTWHCDRTKVPPEQGQNVECTVSVLGSPESRVQDPNFKFFGVFACVDKAAGVPRVDCEEVKDALNQYAGWSGQPAAAKKVLDGQGTNAKATQANIEAALTALKGGGPGKPNPGDELVFYLAGHGSCASVPEGDIDTVTPGDQLHPSNTHDGDETSGSDGGVSDQNVPDGTTDATDAKKDGVMTDDELRDTLSGFPASVTITVMINACQSGGLIDGTADLLDIRDSTGANLTPGHLETFMSSKSTENSVTVTFGTPTKARSIFAKHTKACVEKDATTGKTKADLEGNSDGVTTSKELASCVTPKVANDPIHSQPPVTTQNPQFKDNRTLTTPPPCPNVPPFKFDHELNKCKRIVPNSTKVVTTDPTPPDTINTCTITEGPGGHSVAYVISDCDLDYEKKLPAGTPGSESGPGEPNFQQAQPWNTVVRDSEPGSHQITECVTIQPEDPFVDPDQANNEDCLTFVINQVPPPKVGGISVDPDLGELPLEAFGSSGPNAGVLAGVIAAITAVAITLGGAAWYARRRWLR